MVHRKCLCCDKSHRCIITYSIYTQYRRTKPPIKDFLDTLDLLFTLPYPPSYPRLFKKKESVKVREGFRQGVNAVSVFPQSVKVREGTVKRSVKRKGLG